MLHIFSHSHINFFYLISLSLSLSLNSHFHFMYTPEKFENKWVKRHDKMLKIYCLFILFLSPICNIIEWYRKWGNFFEKEKGFMYTLLYSQFSKELMQILLLHITGLPFLETMCSKTLKLINNHTRHASYIHITVLCKQTMGNNLLQLFS